MESNLHIIWQVEMLKQGIPDPSTVAQGPSVTDTSGDKDRKDSLQDEQIENFADAVFVHTKFVVGSLKSVHEFLFVFSILGCLLSRVLSYDVASDDVYIIRVFGYIFCRN